MHVQGKRWLLKWGGLCSRPQQIQDAEGLSFWVWLGLIYKGVVLSLGRLIHCTGKSTHLRAGRQHRPLSEHQDPCLFFSGARGLQGGI